MAENSKPPDIIDPDDPLSALEDRQGAALVVFDASDGSELAQYGTAWPQLITGYT